MAAIRAAKDNGQNFRLDLTIFHAKYKCCCDLFCRAYQTNYILSVLPPSLASILSYKREVAGGESLVFCVSVAAEFSCRATVKLFVTRFVQFRRNDD